MLKTLTLSLPLSCSWPLVLLPLRVHQIYRFLRMGGRAYGPVHSSLISISTVSCSITGVRQSDPPNTSISSDRRHPVRRPPPTTPIFIRRDWQRSDEAFKGGKQ